MGLPGLGACYFAGCESDGLPDVVPNLGPPSGPKIGPIICAAGPKFRAHGPKIGPMGSNLGPMKPCGAQGGPYTTPDPPPWGVSMLIVTFRGF